MQQRDDPAAQSSVDVEIGIQRQDDRRVVQFAHPDQARIGQGCRPHPMKKISGARFAEVLALLNQILRLV